MKKPKFIIGVDVSRNRAQCFEMELTEEAWKSTVPIVTIATHCGVVDWRRGWGGLRGRGS